LGAPLLDFGSCVLWPLRLLHPEFRLLQACSVSAVGPSPLPASSSLPNMPVGPNLARGPEALAGGGMVNCIQLRAAFAASKLDRRRQPISILGLRATALLTTEGRLDLPALQSNHLDDFASSSDAPLHESSGQHCLGIVLNLVSSGGSQFERRQYGWPKPTT
jgi:hypothetical protein